MRTIALVAASALMLAAGGCGRTEEIDLCGAVEGFHLLRTSGFPDSVYTLIDGGLSLRAGTTYSVYVCAGLGVGPFASNPAVGKPLAVGFVVYNDSLPHHASRLYQVPGRIVRIGTVQVSGDDWSTYTVARWTADADYTGVGCVISPGASLDDPGAVRIGAVHFQE